VLRTRAGCVQLVWHTLYSLTHSLTHALTHSRIMQFVWHFANAFEDEAGRVVLDACAYASFDFGARRPTCIVYT
jgi:hypothetical protein